jgi:hypothetical protein
VRERKRERGEKTRRRECKFAKLLPVGVYYCYIKHIMQSIILLRMPSFEMWCHIDLVGTDVFEECIDPIFRVEYGGDTYLRNVDSYKIYTVPHPRIQYSS